MKQKFLDEINLKDLINNFHESISLKLLKLDVINIDDLNLLIEYFEEITELKIKLIEKLIIISKNTDKINKIKNAIDKLNNIYKATYGSQIKNINKLLVSFKDDAELIKALSYLIDNLAYNIPEEGLKLRKIVHYSIPLSDSEIALIKQDSQWLLEYILIPVSQPNQRKIFNEFIFKNNKLTQHGLELFHHAQQRITEDKATNYLKNCFNSLYQNFTKKQRGQLYQSLAYSLATTKKELANLNATCKKLKKHAYETMGRKFKAHQLTNYINLHHYLTNQINLIKNNFIFLLNQADYIHEYPIIIQNREIDKPANLLKFMLQFFPDYLDIIFTKMMDKGKIAEHEITIHHLVYAFSAFSTSEELINQIDTLEIILNKFNYTFYDYHEPKIILFLALINHLLLSIIETPEYNLTPLMEKQRQKAINFRQSLFKKISTKVPYCDKDSLNTYLFEKLTIHNFIFENSNFDKLLNKNKENYTLFFNKLSEQLMSSFLKQTKRNFINFIFIDRKFEFFVNLFTSKYENFFMKYLEQVFQQTNHLPIRITTPIIDRISWLGNWIKNNFNKINNLKAKTALFLAIYNYKKYDGYPDLMKAHKITKELEKHVTELPKIIYLLLSSPPAKNSDYLFNKEQLIEISKSSFVKHLVDFKEKSYKKVDLTHRNYFLVNRKRTALFRKLLMKDDVNEIIIKNTIDELANNNYLLMSDIISIFIERTMLNKPLNKSIVKHLMKKVMTGEKTHSNWLQFANFSHFLATDKLIKKYKTQLLQSYIDEHTKSKGIQAILLRYEHPLAQRKAFGEVLYEREIKNNPKLIAQLKAEIERDQTIPDNNIFVQPDFISQQTYLAATQKALAEEIKGLAEETLKAESNQSYLNNIEEFLANENNKLLIQDTEISIKNYKNHILSDLKHYQTTNSDKIKQYLSSDKQFSYQDYRYLTKESKDNQLKQALTEHYLNHRMLDTFAKAKETIFYAAHQADKNNLTVRLGFRRNRVSIKQIKAKDYLKINHGNVMNKQEPYSTLSGNMLKDQLEKKITSNTERFMTNEAITGPSITTSGYLIKGNNFKQQKQSLAKNFQHWRATTQNGSKFQTLSMDYKSSRILTVQANSRKKLALDLKRGQEELPTVGIRFYQLHRYLALLFRKIFNGIATKFATLSETNSSTTTSNSFKQKFANWGENNRSPDFTENKKKPFAVNYPYPKRFCIFKQKTNYSPFFISQKNHRKYRNTNKEYLSNKKQIFEESSALQTQALISSPLLTNQEPKWWDNFKHDLKQQQWVRELNFQFGFYKN